MIRYLDEELSKDDNTFLNEEWGPEAAEAMCDEVRDFPVVSGGDKILTIGDLINLTPKEYISKVMLEEKVFQTWFGARTVLLGDGKFLRTGHAGGMFRSKTCRFGQLIKFIRSPLLYSLACHKVPMLMTTQIQ